MKQPTLFLAVGLPATGKTTAARRIEIEQKALRLTKDDPAELPTRLGSCPMRNFSSGLPTSTSRLPVSSRGVNP